MAKLAKIIPDLLIVAGFAAISAGAWLLHPSAGLVVAGVAMIFAGSRMAGE